VVARASVQWQALQGLSHTRAPFQVTTITPDRESAGVAVFRVSKRIETGMTWPTQGLVSIPPAPYRGVKASGLGPEGVEEDLEVKQLVVAV
jgi:acyl-CoA reductase-like NAD-dependent aldehyde dehydrogenase